MLSQLAEKVVNLLVTYILLHTHGETSTLPHPKLIKQETVDFSYNLRKDQKLWRCSNIYILLLQSQSRDSFQKTLKGTGDLRLSPEVPERVYPAGLLGVHFRQAEKEN